MIEIIVKTSDEKKFEISLDRNATLLDFGRKIEGNTTIPVSEQRLISLGKFVKTDEDFSLVKAHHTPNVLVSRRPNVDVPKEQPPVKKKIVKTLVRQKFETAWVLLRNCEACAEAYKNNISPEARERISQPDGLVFSLGENPCAADFGVLTARTSKVYAEMSKMFSECGSKLQKIDNENLELTKKHHKVQLLMDMCRYMAVLNQIISGFIIPMRHASPRFISFKQNPRAR